MMMKRILKIHLFFALSTFVFTAEAAGVNGRIHIIPEPVLVKEKPGTFILDKSVSISFKNADSQLQQNSKWFTDQILRSTGINLLHKNSTKKITISINSRTDETLGKEGYHLTVTPKSILITANSAAGIFYGLQTIIQLLPPEISTDKRSIGVRWTIPAAEITDYPRFAWRGLMLDVSRHFYTKAEVKKFIDGMVKYKYNTLHWHLTDDQGWRIEIKSLPELTQKGAFRVKRTGRWGTFPQPLPNEEATDGGFYTQDDIREIVKYAQEKYITILPEVDVPGHSLTLISTYPNLSNTKNQYSVNAGWRSAVHDDNALDPSNEEVYSTLDKVFTEIAQLFPNPYIHVGGDEAYKGYWEKNPSCQALMAKEGLKDVEELQSYFIKRLVKILQSKGKKLIGWDEILQGGLAPEATVMSWRGMNGGIEAAKMGHQVVMTPWDYVYLDLYQGDPLVEPDTYGICRLTDSYNYDPVPNGIDEKLILGGQGNLWTESVPTYRHLEYMIWPRAIALSEVYWSPKSKKSWPNFFGKLEKEFHRMDLADINYAKSCYNVVYVPVKIGNDELSLRMQTEALGLDIYYTFDNTNPDMHAAKYAGSAVTFPIGATQINAVTYRNGRQIGKQINIKKDELIKRSQAAHHVY